jgi:HSP20 family protein
MANITPFSTLRDMERWDPRRDFEDFFKDFWSRPLTMRNGDMPADIRLDVAEDDKNFVVKADVPGVSKDDIQVAIDGNQVSITAETKSEKEETGKNTIRRERYYGKQYRSFVLSAEIDDSKAQASYKDGVLQLILPKKAGTAPKKLDIH